MYKKITIITLCFILSVAIIIIFKYKREKDNYQKSLQNLKNAYIEVVISQYKGWQILSDSLKNTQLSNQKDSIDFYSLLKGNKIIFYFTNKMCEPCIKKELDNLKKLGINIGFDNIIVIGKSINPILFEDNQFLPFTKNIWRCNNSIYNNMSPEEVPVIILTHNTNILNVYYSNKMTNNTSQYFQYFIEKKLNNMTSRVKYIK